MPIIQTYSAIKILERSAYLSLSEERDNSSRLLYYDKNALFDFASSANAEAIIKSTLRIYTGLFTNFAYINEKTIAQQSATTPEQVYEVLKALSAAKLASYVPRSSTPLLTFLQNRFDSKRLYIGRESFEDLQQRFEKRMKSVLDYATMRHRCRSQILLSYFGEDIKACGHCDVCLAHERASLSNEEYENMSNVIVDRLRAKPLHIETLIDSLPYDEEKLISTLRQLLDDGVVKYNDVQELTV